MKNILIPTDFSDSSKNAIRYALDFFEKVSCHFFLLYVNTEGSDFSERPVYEFGTSVLVEKAPKAIDEKLIALDTFIMSLPSKKEHHHFHSIREKNYFLKSIRRHIQEKHIELIIMGTQGASELKEFFTGTRSGDVITKVECDILVVPEKAKFNGLKQVVFPIDFEVDLNERMLRRMLHLIPWENMQIKLLYVTKSNIRLYDALEAKRELLMKKLSVILSHPASFHRVISKNIEEGIKVFAESSNADLIVMLSKDYGLLQTLFLDTTVEEVSFNTKIPLLSLQA